MAALDDAESAAAFVQALLFRARDAGDREYDELRVQLAQQSLALESLATVQGKNHPNVRILRERVEALRGLVADKEQRIVRAELR